MLAYKRTIISDKYFAIQILECPIDIVMHAASLGSKHVQIENYRHYRNPNSLKILIQIGDFTIQPITKEFTVDFQISNAEFISLKEIWDTQGCYAVFYDCDDLKVKSTNLQERARYKVLDNFKWTLEIAIPDSASNGWGQIVSPYQSLIDKIESYMQSLYQIDNTLQHE
jgi:hypothetical protein